MRNARRNILRLYGEGYGFGGMQIQGDSGSKETGWENFTLSMRHVTFDTPPTVFWTSLWVFR